MWRNTFPLYDSRFSISERRGGSTVGTPEFIKQILRDIEGEIDSNGNSRGL